MQLTTQLLCLTLAPLVGERTPIANPAPVVTAPSSSASALTSTALRGPSLHWGDFDRDGALDVFIATPGGSDHLFRNEGRGELVDVTERAGLGSSAQSRAATWFDFDADGDLDLFTASDTSASRLWSNDGQGVFSDVTRDAGLASELPDLDVLTLDFDGDGRTDLQRSTLRGDRLFRNTGDGRFEELELVALLAAGPGQPVQPVLPKPAPKGTAPAGSSAPTTPGTSQLAAGLGSSGVISTTLLGPATLASSSFICAGSVEDIMNPGTCVPLSSVPTFGMLYPLGPEFNIDAAGQVGIGTTTPNVALDVVGDVRSSGQLQSFETVSPPIQVFTTVKVPLLNVDLLDGLDSADFTQLGTSISGAEIDDLSVTADDLANLTVTGSKIAGSAITSAHIQTGAVGNTKLADLAVSASKLATDSVTTSKLKDDSVTNAKLAANAVTSNEIQNGSVTGSDLAASSVESIHIFPNTINSLDIATGGVLSDEIQDSTILDEDISPLAAITGTKVNANFGSQTVTSNGSSLIPATKGVGLNGPTNGYLGVQGTNDFDGVAAADWAGEELGVVGISNGSSATDNYGVSGLSNYVGVRGQGGQYGVQGLVTADGATGVLARSTSLASTSTALRAEMTALGSVGTAIVGEAPFYGIAGRATDNGIGFLGEALTGLGGYAAGNQGFLGVANGSGQVGVTGHANSGSFAGVEGHSYATSGVHYGVLGKSESTSGRGVRGEAFAIAGTTYGVQGRVHSTNGWGVISYGASGATGQKNFIQPHPTDPSQELHFFSLEGNESGTYFRGTSHIVGGVCVIEVPEEFRLVSAEQGLTVQLTTVGAPAVLWTESRDLNQVIVRSNTDVQFDYTVNGVRRGFEEVEIFADNHSFVPETRGVPFGTQYPDSYREILVASGILNADYTPNESTAAQQGWELQDFDPSRGSQSEPPAVKRYRELQQQVPTPAADVDEQD